MTTGGATYLQEHSSLPGSDVFWYYNSYSVTFTLLFLASWRKSKKRLLLLSLLLQVEEAIFRVGVMPWFVWKHATFYFGEDTNKRHLDIITPFKWMPSKKDNEWDSKVIWSKPIESIQKLGNTFHRKLIKDQSSVDSLTKKSEGY